MVSSVCQTKSIYLENWFVVGPLCEQTINRYWQRFSFTFINYSGRNDSTTQVRQ